MTERTHEPFLTEGLAEARERYLNLLMAATQTTPREGLPPLLDRIERLVEAWFVLLEHDPAQDAKRWHAMRNLFVGADFNWGDPPIPVLCFELPKGVRVTAGPDGADAAVDEILSLSVRGDYRG